MSFQFSKAGNVIIWTGSPDCQAAHNWVLEWLTSRNAPFLAEGEELGPRRKGNFGECIAFQIGSANLFNGEGDYTFPANALNPLVNNARPGVDIVWIRFGNSVSDDLAVLQEVKVTTQAGLDYANNLIADYDKLFSTDPAVTLQTRLQDVKNELELKLKRRDLCARVAEITGNSPKTAEKVKIIPTLIHDLRTAGSDTKMLTIRQTLCGKGWANNAVSAWAIGMTELEERLIRLAMGRP